MPKAGFPRRLRDHFTTNSRAYNILCQLTLALLSLLLYSLVILLYLKPKVFSLESLIDPFARGPSPQVLVSIGVAILGAATSSWTTRCVEHYLWLQLAQPLTEDHRGVTLGEAQRLAQWTVSPLQRILYFFSGRLWSLKISGALLLLVAFVNTALLAGISNQSYQITGTEHVPPDDSTTPFSGYVMAANDRYRGGQYRDIPTEIAATVTLSNLTIPPVATLCGSNTSCKVQARVAALNADCHAKSYTNVSLPLAGSSEVEIINPDPDSIELIGRPIVYKSQLNPGNTATLNPAVSPFYWANFSSSYIGGTSGSNTRNAPGDFSNIFGAWAFGGEYNADRVLFTPSETVDCNVHFGWVWATQIGSNSPTLDSTTFEKNDTEGLSKQIGLMVIGRIYGESNRSPFSFTGAAVGTGANSIFDDPIGYLLLDETAYIHADVVGRRIEKVFQMATLMAWGRQPSAAHAYYTTTITKTHYVYDSRYLLVLFIPVIAAFLGGIGKWHMGDSREVPGYNPMVIASRGPVIGVARLWDGITPEDEDRPVGSIVIDNWPGVSMNYYGCLQPVQSQQ
ncbi:hypothetical protein L211DRAFT_659542 [Terfezia boudieri ATCC MYA-4762]|uniref:Uncharacterized protein n=1 Tax=Terfezia boudieri ATCC MYA-4762 TaxID=1051890 RepID=A0A3N4LVG3_9PEZI|nr:hypothetical protein L211DRAFT_659542 [Terfezia boudieri ATCC MYA-4762]